ncbi:MAG: ATP-binding cassette domain-containing protein [Betaproteobacteria bacterium]|nr:ATP-binding cassette domain-containing protein [Betaproteobacteria bacterium]
MLAALGESSLAGSNAAATPAVRIAGLQKRYGAREVLEGVDLEVASGAAFGLVGVNGAGKTTLVKCLLDFCDFQAGVAEIFGIASRTTGACASCATSSSA